MGVDLVFIQEELKDVKRDCEQKIEGSELIACVPEVVRVKIERTQHKQLIALLHFSNNYPHSPLVVELKSKTLDEKLLGGLANVCEQEAKKYLGGQQVMLILKFLRKFIDENPLCVCRDEINKINKDFMEACDELKLKQKASQLAFKVVQEKYFLKFKLNIPEVYPLTQVSVEIAEHNFPALLLAYFNGQSTEIARQCIQPPLKKNPKAPPFVPKPSVLPVAQFLIKDCVKKYPLERCPCCSERALPENPQNVITDEKNPMHVERMYCGHIFHNGCLDVYMKTPPFTGGKKCPTCNNRIYHDKWKVTPQLAEARWAHKEAKRRELDEVVDFLQ